MHALCVTGLVVLITFACQVNEIDANEYCLRKDGQEGKCVELSSCTKIATMIRTKKREGRRFTPNEQTYILNSKCDPHNSGFVCCVEEVSPEGMQILKEQDCGYMGGNKKTIGGVKVKLLSRPWMALLRFKVMGEEEFACGGTLITNRYVLTAAHCFQNNLVSIRLGEYKISNVTDCEYNKSKLICAPPVEDILHEKIIIHPDYSRMSGLYDIALIKLSRNVEIKKNIRPICLPVNETLQNEPERLNEFRVSGWGKTETEPLADDLMETKINRRPRQDCRNAFPRVIRQSQICAGNLGKDSCTGDSGGPLLNIGVYNDKQRFIQYGIVSYGSPNCGNIYPGVYTNVGNFIPWITKTIVEN